MDQPEDSEPVEWKWRRVVLIVGLAIALALGLGLGLGLSNRGTEHHTPAPTPTTEPFPPPSPSLSPSPILSPSPSGPPPPNPPPAAPAPSPSPSPSPGPNPPPRTFYTEAHTFVFGGCNMVVDPAIAAPYNLYFSCQNPKMLTVVSTDNTPVFVTPAFITSPPSLPSTQSASLIFENFDTTSNRSVVIYANLYVGFPLVAGGDSYTGHYIGLSALLLHCASSTTCKNTTFADPRDPLWFLSVASYAIKQSSAAYKTFLSSAQLTTTSGYYQLVFWGTANERITLNGGDNGDFNYVSPTLTVTVIVQPNSNSGV